MRAFIAIPCPGSLKEKIIRIQNGVRGMGKIAIVKPENIHLTLKFLGEIDKSQIPKIKEKLEFLSDFQNFEISLMGAGVFPTPDYVRVIWIGVDWGSDKIIEIHSKINKELKKLGFKPDKNFHPHLTIARVKFPADKEGIKRLVQRNSDLNLGIFRADRIELIESRLSPQDPKYSVIHKIELG